MAEPTLTDVFGAAAAQTASTLTISKADLAAAGLTASASNTAESLLAAIILFAKTKLSPNTFDANSDQSITIEKGFNSIVSRTTGSTTTEYRQFQYNVGFHKLDNTTLDPDDL